MSSVGPASEVPDRENWIGGRERPPAGGELTECASPSDRRLIAARYPRSGEADVEAAVTAAAAAQSEWAAMPLGERERVLFDASLRVEAAAEEIGTVMASEMAKPLAEAAAEAMRAGAVLRFFAGELRRPLGETFESDDPDTFLYTLRRPLGVVALITPWNFPVAIPAWKLAPALAYGNSVVLKPASHAPGAALILARCLAEAGLPAGALNVVIGSGGEVGGPLLSDPRVAAVSYTGSNAVGASVREASATTGKRVQLELGGQNPAIVLADADLDQAAAAIVSGAFGAAGQKCTATRRAIVDRAVADSLCERICARVGGLVVGDPFDSETSVSALIDGDAVTAFEGAVEGAVAAGGTVIAGGARLTEGELEYGNFVAPTVIHGVAPGSELAREEVFAPLLGVIEVNGYEQALAVANEVRYGLSASLFTRDLGHARRFAAEIEAGVLHVNSQTAGADVHVPFGGSKESGYGPREQGRAAREFFSESTTVYEGPPEEPA